MWLSRMEAASPCVVLIEIHKEASEIPFLQSFKLPIAKQTNPRIHMQVKWIYFTIVHARRRKTGKDMTSANDKLHTQRAFRWTAGSRQGIGTACRVIRASKEALTISIKVIGCSTGM